MPSSLTINAREVQATESHFMATHRGRHEIRWELCSENLAQATHAERAQMRISPSKCAIR